MPLDLALTAHLATLEAAIEHAATHKRFTQWYYPDHPGERSTDTVVAAVDLRAVEHDTGRERLLTVTQWLGYTSAASEVSARYSARELRGGPMVLWRSELQDAGDIVFWDVRRHCELPPDVAAVARLAAVAPYASPVDLARLQEGIPRQTFFDRLEQRAISLLAMFGEDDSRLSA